MAASVGLIGGRSSSATSSFGRRLDWRKSSRSGRVSVAMASARSTTADPYEILQIGRGASESEVKKAFRQLALKHHPDVCKGNNCGIQFHQINEAYDAVMERFREELKGEDSYGSETDEGFRGMYDEDWDMWEEWMGWEGAGIRDYSSHINPYI
ncbi:hypothetical protein V2J09_003071 [Rumex salicifolius]